MPSKTLLILCQLGLFVATKGFVGVTDQKEVVSPVNARDYITVLEEKTKEASSASGGGPYFPYSPDRGYINVYEGNNSMWYWHFEAQKNPETAPLIVWLTGGPGAGSTISVFVSTGPFKLLKWPTEEKKAKLNPYSWNLKANMLYPDIPLGMGFSTVTGDRLALDAKEGTKQFMIFFKKFLEKYPQYKKRPLYLGGASYGGHWVAYIGDALRSLNNPDINLKGIYASDVLIDSTPMEESYFKYGLMYSNYTKLTEKAVIALTPLKDLCVYSIGAGRNQLHVKNTFDLCWTIFYSDGLIKPLQKKNPYFVPEYIPGWNHFHPDFDGSYEKFLNNPSVQAYLGVRKSTFVPWNRTYYKEMGQNDIFLPVSPIYTKLLDAGIKVVILCGVYDWVTNYLMSEAVTASFKWKWQNEFNAVRRAPCKYGLCKEYKNLREIRVNGAGHGVSVYQPEFALEIITQLISE